MYINSEWRQNLETMTESDFFHHTHGHYRSHRDHHSYVTITTDSNSRAVVYTPVALLGKLSVDYTEWYLIVESN